MTKRTKNRIFGRIRRMKEIFLMWRIVRLLKKHGSVWSVQMTRQKITKEMENSGKEASLKKSVFAEKDPQFYDKVVMVELEERTLKSIDGRLRGKRSALIGAYMQEYYPKFSGIDKFASEERILKEGEISNLIDLCIDDEREFIKPDKNDAKIVYLTRNGTDFSDLLGLFKEYVRSISVIQWVIIWVLAVLLTHLKTIIELFKDTFSL